MNSIRCNVMHSLYLPPKGGTSPSAGTLRRSRVAVHAAQKPNLDPSVYCNHPSKEW